MQLIISFILLGIRGCLWHTNWTRLAWQINSCLHVVLTLCHQSDWSFAKKHGSFLTNDSYVLFISLPPLPHSSLQVNVVFHMRQTCQPSTPSIPMLSGSSSPGTAPTSPDTSSLHLSQLEKGLLCWSRGTQIYNMYIQHYI